MYHLHLYEGKRRWRGGAGGGERPPPQKRREFSGRDQERTRNGREGITRKIHSYRISILCARGDRTVWWWWLYVSIRPKKRIKIKKKVGSHFFLQLLRMSTWRQSGTIIASFWNISWAEWDNALEKGTTASVLLFFFFLLDFFLLLLECSLYRGWRRIVCDGARSSLFFLSLPFLFWSIDYCNWEASLFAIYLPTKL